VPTASELDSVRRTGCIPAPIGFFDGTRDFPRFCPGDPIVVAVGHEDASSVFAGAIADFAFAIRAEVPGHQEPNGAGCFINDGSRITATVVAVGPNDLLSAPGFAAVGGTFEEQVDFAGVAAAVFAAFAKGEEGLIGGDDDGWDTVGVIAVGSGSENVGGDREGGGGSRRS